MAVKVVRRPELTFWEKLYIPQILCGLKITFTHFFRNLFLHTAHLLGRFKNLPAREDHTPRCVGCMLCETVCPAKCITIVPGEHPDPNIEKYPVRFDIDLGVCVYCGYCVEVCPEDAIRMDTGILDVAAYSREAMRLDIHELMDPGLRKPISHCNLTFPHKCELTGGEMKGSWDTPCP